MFLTFIIYVFDQYVDLGYVLYVFFFFFLLKKKKIRYSIHFWPKLKHLV